MYRAGADAHSLWVFSGHSLLFPQKEAQHPSPSKVPPVNADNICSLFSSVVSMRHRFLCPNNVSDLAISL